MISLGFNKQPATFAGVDRDTLRAVAEADSTMLAIPLVPGMHVEVQRGQRSYWGEGALLGMVVFGVGTGALAAATYEEPEPCTTAECEFFRGGWNWSKGAMFATGFVGGAILGGVAGGLIGKTFETDRWVRIPRDRLRLSVAPRRNGGLALGVSVRF
jgi:hypothetical protein